jgi:hypothetical protein
MDILAISIGAIATGKVLAQRRTLGSEIMRKRAGSTGWAVTLVEVRLAGSRLIGVVGELAIAVAFSYACVSSSSQTNRIPSG